MQPRSPFPRQRFTIFALVLLATTIGCRKASVTPTAPPKPFTGATINVTVPDGTARLLLERQGKAWALANGATLVLKSRREGDAVPGDVDIVAFNPAEMGRLVDAQALAPLPESITGSGSWTQLSRVYQTRLLGWGAATYAVPLVGDATILIYRADLFAAANRKPPDSFADFLELAKQFATERQQPCLPPLSNVDALDREFFTVAAAFMVKPLSDSELKKRVGNDPAIARTYGFHFDVETGKPRLTEPGFGQALEWLSASQAHRIKNGTLVEAFESDRAVFGLGTLSDLAALKPSSHPKRYAVAPTPAAATGDTIPYFGPGGVLAAVTKSAKVPEVAAAMLRHLSDLPAGLEIVHSPEYAAAPYRAAHMNERPDGWYNWGFDKPGTDSLRYALTKATDPRAINAPSRLRIRDEAKYRRLLLDGLREVLDKNADPAKTLQAIADQWETLDTRPASEKKDEYLRSLNLKR